MGKIWHGQDGQKVQNLQSSFKDATLDGVNKFEVEHDWLIDWFLVFNATFSNISAISCQPVLVVEEAGVPWENHRPWASNWWSGAWKNEEIILNTLKHSMSITYDV